MRAAAACGVALAVAGAFLPLVAAPVVDGVGMRQVAPRLLWAVAAATLVAGEMLVSRRFRWLWLPGLLYLAATLRALGSINPVMSEARLVLERERIGVAGAARELLAGWFEPRAGLVLLLAGSLLLVVSSAWAWARGTDGGSTGAVRRGPSIGG
jgi:hypothetical protein